MTTPDGPYGADMEPVGRWLRRERQRLGLTQVALAARSGVNLSYINRIEMERVKTPTRRVLVRLLQGLGIDPHVRDGLLLHAGYLPVDPLGYLLQTEPEALELVRLLGDPTVPASVKGPLRHVLAALATVAHATKQPSAAPAEAAD
ncbi:MAG TPA: helix-turn-helix transcriptional regulator [Zeimonas sp.]|jgi:transcriptional regulator with XRE-family HTH domain|nr:helix-turn-helix transcriptional regulator [Zeimonas sp.]